MNSELDLNKGGTKPASLENMVTQTSTFTNEQLAGISGLTKESNVNPIKTNSGTNNLQSNVSPIKTTPGINNLSSGIKPIESGAGKNNLSSDIKLII